MTWKTIDTSCNRLCTKSSPAFFIGCSPSQAKTILDTDCPASGVMVSVNQLRKRKSNFEVGSWLLDSGAFTEISKYGDYQYSVEEYYYQICRWACCGNLLRAVAQDFMCESFVLERTGLTIKEHQRLTIKRYDQLFSYKPPVPIMPVLQGWQTSDYIEHLQQYQTRLTFGEWVGVGSVCRRNSNPEIIKDILRGIKLFRPDLNLHGFGLKQIALEDSEVRSLLYSCDSMSWSYPLRFRPENDSVQNPLTVAKNYQQGIHQRLIGQYTKTVPKTAGSGNGQGRKPKWKSKTTAIRVPEKYADRLFAIAKKWDEKEV